MKHYEKPEVEIIAITEEDIIITSTITPEAPGSNNATNLFPTY